ncbi:hypothetical protein MSA03_15700 [Microbacterium saccharophilum]|nr:hypothetical protein MSA03_15700 [Microbacterium saccharophilum]
MRRGAHAIRCRVTGQSEQVVSLRGVEAERPSQRREHLGGRLRSTPLLEPVEVVGRHRRELRDLLAPQTRRPAPRTAGEPDILRLQCVAAAAEELRELISVHRTMLVDHPAPSKGSRIPRSALPGCRCVPR